jgi:hypothetical protein
MINTSDEVASPLASDAAGEQDEAGHEDPLTTENVSSTAAQQQEAAEGQRVGVDHPLQI